MSTTEWIDRLDRELAHVLEPAMHRSLVREAALAASDDALYDLCRAALTRPPADPSGRDPLRDAVHALLRGDDGVAPLDYDRRAELYARAASDQDETLLRVLRTQPAHLRAERPERLLPKELADIPLGRRRSLAKGGVHTVLEGLARDHDPIVIRHLLANPRMREEDVVRMAALRPVAPGTLAEIHGCPRFRASPRVRAAVARNPYCPTALAVELVRGLAIRDLRELARDPDLHPETIAQARSELSLRGAA